MPNLSVRGVGDAALEKIKSAARQRGVSVNAYLVELIQREAGFATAGHRPRHHDLDALAGTWDEADAREFAHSQQDFSRIDVALWPDSATDQAVSASPSEGSAR